MPKDDLRDSSSWSSSALMLLRDIHSKLIDQYDYKEVCAPSPSQVNTGARARLSSQDGVLDEGVGGVAVDSGSRARPSHSCDGWVCDLGAVVTSSIFGLVRGTGTFTVVCPTFVLVSRMKLVEQYRGNDHFLSAASSSRREAVVGGAPTRVSVGRPSTLGHTTLDHALDHHIRVMGGCVIWVWWSSHRYLGWYVGPGLSLRCFRLLF